MVTARNLEDTFAREKVRKQLLKSEKKADKKQVKMTGKGQSERLKKLADIKWGADERFKSKFVEMGMKV